MSSARNKTDQDTDVQTQGSMTWLESRNASRDRVRPSSSFDGKGKPRINFRYASQIQGDDEPFGNLSPVPHRELTGAAATEARQMVKLIMKNIADFRLCSTRQMIPFQLELNKYGRALWEKLNTRFHEPLTMGNTAYEEIESQRQALKVVQKAIEDHENITSDLLQRLIEHLEDYDEWLKKNSDKLQSVGLDQNQPEKVGEILEIVRDYDEFNSNQLRLLETILSEYELWLVQQLNVSTFQLEESNSGQQMDEAETKRQQIEKFLNRITEFSRSAQVLLTDLQVRLEDYESWLRRPYNLQRTLRGSSPGILGSPFVPL
ncbi:unnamed protein product [Calicophoron daubneyi]|uniref:Uncharacterized protein n=1 Tax=Calicophoron daubneyi TaxID=300641 RepID=A0AAV2TMH0_CALDB